MKLLSILLFINAAALVASFHAAIAPREPQVLTEHRKRNVTTRDEPVAKHDHVSAALEFVAADPPPPNPRPANPPPPNPRPANPPPAKPHPEKPHPDDPPDIPAYRELMDSGCSLIAMMTKKDAAAARYVRPVNTLTTAASQWTDFQSLNDWGWELDPKSDRLIWSEWFKPSIDLAMKDLGLPPLKMSIEGGTSMPRVWDHTRDTVHDSVQYRATEGSLQYVVDVHNGFLIAHSRFSPGSRAQKQDPPVTVLPKLKSSSDVMFLDYAHVAEQAGQPVNKLKYFFCENVVNQQTSFAVYHALDEELTEESCAEYLWPDRVILYPDDHGYRAILASPNGRAFALMLAQRKAVFGERRMIESISIYCQQGDAEFFNLLFTVRDHDGPDSDGN